MCDFCITPIEKRHRGRHTGGGLPHEPCEIRENCASAWISRSVGGGGGSDSSRCCRHQRFYSARRLQRGSGVRTEPITAEFDRAWHSPITFLLVFGRSEPAKTGASRDAWTRTRRRRNRQPPLFHLGRLTVSRPKFEPRRQADHQRSGRRRLQSTGYAGDPRQNDLRERYRFSAILGAIPRWLLGWADQCGGFSFHCRPHGRRKLPCRRDANHRLVAARGKRESLGESNKPPCAARHRFAAPYAAGLTGAPHRSPFAAGRPGWREATEGACPK